MIGLAYIIAGGLFEPIWVFALEKAGRSEGIGKVRYLVVCVLSMFMSMTLLSKGMDAGVDVGVSYAIWTAIGAVTTIFIARVLYAEPITRLKAVALSMILLGIAGLQIAGGARYEGEPLVSSAPGRVLRGHVGHNNGPVRGIHGHVLDGGDDPDMRRERLVARSRSESRGAHG